MKWHQRKSRKGRNGYQVTIGEIKIEVFRDFATKNWILKIPGMVRVPIADSSVSQEEVVLDQAEKVLKREVAAMQRKMATIHAALTRKRTTDSPVVSLGRIWDGGTGHHDISYSDADSGL